MRNANKAGTGPDPMLSTPPDRHPWANVRPPQYQGMHCPNAGMASDPCLRVTLAIIGLLLALAGPRPLWGAEGATNLARGPGTTPFGNCSDGPFTIGKINDGRFDTLGMWCTGGQPGSFGGVKLGAAPVTFNTVRFYLFNGRAAFTGWRIEGSNDVAIDDDSLVGTVYDPEFIATDAVGQFTNAATKEHNVVTVSFPAVSYKFVRLVFPNKSGRVGVPEMEVFAYAHNPTPAAALTGAADAVVDNMKNTLTLPRAAPVGEVLGRLTKPAGVLLDAYDASGKRLALTDPLNQECRVLAMHGAGGQTEPFQFEYKCYLVLDASLPPPAPKVYTPAPRPPPPPKPQMTPAVAPEAPADAVNLLIGKTITASIDPVHAAALAQTGSGNWFAQQRYPQWLAVDFGDETEFDYLALQVAGALSLQKLCVQTSHDQTAWDTQVLVDHVRRNTQWAGYFPKIKARHVRLLLLPPSGDVHIRRLFIANLAQPLTDKAGQPAPVIKPFAGATPDFSNLPKAATAAEGETRQQGTK